jgi:hypothetical protein
MSIFANELDQNSDDHLKRNIDTNNEESDQHLHPEVNNLIIRVLFANRVWDLLIFVNLGIFVKVLCGLVLASDFFFLLFAEA